ncbi:hypothetical protein DIE21_15275 [Burkholderia sp. Bp9140]|uniref:LamG-like jellyroll fold domain-containing protein n=1 Tax=Burkholderia sp. Bp9140 TaxID=2184572 RepID=UPI000F57B558|nr:LamG-like jellyroll fold domain-containing protein [Burkholderia sp. Bp9140]RQR51284.1 hypothetical protein DIE21_15275 [Burkholderia sp. Bp9140]
MVKKRKFERVRTKILSGEQSERGINRGERAVGVLDPLWSIGSNISRRTFLQGLGALALTGCGSGFDNDTTSRSAASSRQIAVSAQSEINSFVHPGLLHTQSDFNRMAQKVAASASPWIDSWNKLLGSSFASSSWTPNPHAVVYRNYPGQPDNFLDLCHDAAAAYANALIWKIRGDTAAANTAVAILNAWGATLTQIATTNGYYDGYLVAGLQGYQIANAAEIMRTYSGWVAQDFAAFQRMMLSVFYPMNQGTSGLTGNAPAVYSSWDLSAMAMVLSVGVLCDNQTIFEEAITYFQKGIGNGAIAQMVYYMHPGYLGQTQEAGRDQGHDTLSISIVSNFCEMAWNQGIDLYGYANNRVLAACEYVAKGNLIQTGSTYYPVPFSTYVVPGGGTDTVFSTLAQGTARPEWALIYNHYVNRRGIASPFSGKFASLVSPEGGAGYYGTTSGGFDQLGYGTLTHTLDPVGAGASPSGLSAVTQAGQVVLSWWGTAYATSYTVKRSTTSGGAYAVVASGISDLLTYTDTGLSPGKYYYVVTATVPSGETAASNIAPAVIGVLLDTDLPFNDATGMTAVDGTGNAHNGTLLGGATWVTDSVRTAVSLNGNGAYVSLPDDIVLAAGDFTIATWVYWNGSQTWARIFDFGASINRYMFLTPYDSNGRLSFSMSLSQGYLTSKVEGPGPLISGSWTHVAVTLGGNTATLYVNGNAVASSDAMMYYPCDIGHSTKNWVGRSQFENDPTFNGKIAGLRIYRGTLSASQVAALASS